MATESRPAKYDNSLQDLAQNAVQSQSRHSHYVVRLPIMDTFSNVEAYELLFWDGMELSTGWKNELATHAVFGNAMVFGIEELTSGKPAFVRCTAESLTEEWIWKLPPELTVVQIREDSSLTRDQFEACSKLKKLGFRLAIDDFTRKTSARFLWEMADYVMVDIPNLDPHQRQFLRAFLDGIAPCPIAKNVESQEEYRKLWGAGFKLFQGHYFCRPEPVRDRQIPANRALHIQILEAMQREPIDLDHLSHLIMGDASLTYSLLRLANSPSFGIRQEVTSIHSALMLMGEERTQRIAMLAIATDFDSGQPAELLRMAFERGRFCELAAELLGLSPSEQYLIGMVSMFPAMLRMSVENLVSLLPLREEARNALLGRENREGVLLKLMVCQDQRDWETHSALVKANGLRPDQLMWRCADARDWANAAIQSMG